MGLADRVKEVHHQLCVFCATAQWAIPMKKSKQIFTQMFFSFKK
jgi:hypothetical protein